MKSTTKPRLVILSDLWGTKNSQWLNNYTSILDQHFDTAFYNSTDLAEIEMLNLAQDQIHQRFIANGINKAVENLLKHETESINILAFSIGGTIAWKAALKGLKVKNLFAVSATRLRYETEKPAGKIELFFGDDDSFLPDLEWFDKLIIKKHIFTSQDHEMYRQKEIAYEICSVIVRELTANPKEN